MFVESAWSRKAIGDVDVVFHEGLYHLFHLVLPNHDFVAHAISDNGLNWRRVDNAIFIGHPGSWDDLMLWTMHVTADPHGAGWRMFYTGLSRRDQGLKQRIGLATSQDLYVWHKTPVNWKDLRGANDPELVKQARAKLPRLLSNSLQSPISETSCFPLEPDPAFYEADVDGPRNWISFRDPFYFHDGERGLLLAAARTKDGPLVRRGCVALMEENSPHHFTFKPPLHAPQLYDDIEVPNLIKLNNEYYLIGSQREDAKIRYWHTRDLQTLWRNYYDNVLLPQGNYAGRVCRDEAGILLWNFYTENSQDRTANNIMPPPKRLQVCDDGQLKAVTYEQFDERANGTIDTRCVRLLKDRARDAHSHHAPQYCHTDQSTLQLGSEAGFQAFVFEESVGSFRLAAKLTMQGSGKCGLVSRVDDNSHDGYYISLDLLKGLAQMRSWGTGPLRSGEEMMQFKSLQTGNWYDPNPRDISIQLLAFGSYHELSINGSIVLSLVHDRFTSGLLGFYVETADLLIEQLKVDKLAPPTQSDEHLTTG